MYKFIFLSFALFFSAASLRLHAQTFKEFKDLSDIAWYHYNYDSSLYYALRAEVLLADSVGRESKEYGQFVGQYLSMNYGNLEKKDSARYWYVYGIEKMENHHDTASLVYGETMTTFGSMLNDMGFYAEALPYVKKGFAVISHYPEALDSYYGSINNLANSYNYFGDYPKAEVLYLQSLDGINKYPESFESTRKAILLNNLASIYLKTGSTADAIHYLKESAAYSKAIDTLLKIPNNRFNYFEANKNLGDLYLKLDSNQLAEKIFTALYNDSALNNHTGSDPDNLLALEYVQVINGLGNVRNKQKDFSAAEKLFLQSLPIAEKLRNPRASLSSLSNLALFYASRGQHARANMFFENIITLFKEKKFEDRHYFIANYLNYCENLLRLNQPVKAAENIRRVGDELLADIYKIFPAMPESRQLDYQQTFKQYRRILAASITGKNVTDTSAVAFALNHLLQLKGIILTYQQRRLQLLRNSSDTALTTLTRKWTAAKEELYRQARISVKNTKTDSLNEAITGYERLIAAKTGVRPENTNGNLIAEISSRLGGHQAAIEFIRYSMGGRADTMYGAFVLRKNSPVQFVPLCMESSLKKCFFYIGSGTYQPGEQVRKSQQIYNLVWKPLQESLKGADSFFYSPDGLLNYISFDAIGPGLKNQLLVKNNVLMLLPNLRNLLNLKTADNSFSSAEVWGNIDYNLEGVYASRNPPNQNSPLTQTKGSSLVLSSLINDELPQLDSLMQAQKMPPVVYKDTQATEEHFKQRAPGFNSLLHISSHGFYRSNPANSFFQPSDSGGFTMQQNPLLRCGLILSGGQYAWAGYNRQTDDEDGLLTGYEIAMMDLSKVKLAVISACETALGDIDPGREGVIGLQRAFKLAGARQIVLTLWKVEAEKTKAFMQIFYHYLLTLKKTPADALLQTKRDMVKKESNPLYWAAFVLVE